MISKHDEDLDDKRVAWIVSQRKAGHLAKLEALKRQL